MRKYQQKAEPIKICTKGRVKKKQWNNTKKEENEVKEKAVNCVLMP